jgi:hypothetical protein
LASASFFSLLHFFSILYEVITKLVIPAKSQSFKNDFSPLLNHFFDKVSYRDDIVKPYIKYYGGKS